MQTVDPIRDRAKIEEIKHNLRNQPRNLLLFVLGMNSALRASDLIRLRVKDVYRQGHYAPTVTLRQQKTGKEVTFSLPPPIHAVLDLYFKAHPRAKMDDYLYYRTNGRGRDPSDHITTHQTWRLVKEWCAQAKLTGRFGSHTLRKTWGYHAYHSGIPLERIAKKLGQRDIRVTKDYIGITQEEVTKDERQVCL